MCFIMLGRAGGVLVSVNGYRILKTPLRYDGFLDTNVFPNTSDRASCLFRHGKHGWINEFHLRCTVQSEIALK